MIQQTFRNATLTVSISISCTCALTCFNVRCLGQILKLSVVLDYKLSYKQKHEIFLKDTLMSHLNIRVLVIPHAYKIKFSLLLHSQFHSPQSLSFLTSGQTGQGNILKQIPPLSIAYAFGFHSNNSKHLQMYILIF